MMDIIQTLGFLVYGYLHLTVEHYSGFKENLHIMVILCSGIRGLFSLLKCNNNTRYLTRLIIQVILSTTNYILIQFSVMLIFAAILFKLELIEPDSKNHIDSIFDAFYVSLGLIMGNNDYQYNTPYKKIYLIAAYIYI